MGDQMKPHVTWSIPAEGSKYRLIWKASSSAAIAVVGMINKIWLCKFNNVKIYAENTLHDAIEKRSQDTALITVCNHFSCLDDPLLWGCLKWKAYFQPKRMRWSIAAHDICFTNKFHSYFVGLGKVVPVIRGGSIYQKGMDFVLGQLNQGQWLHIFPEGRVNMAKEFIRFKWGVGRLITECEKKVLVLPFYHVGMDDILPNEKPYIPRVGKKVTILIGTPLDFQAHIEHWKQSGWTQQSIRKEITDTIQTEVEKLRIETFRLHKKFEMS